MPGSSSYKNSLLPPHAAVTQIHDKTGADSHFVWGALGKLIAPSSYPVPFDQSGRFRLFQNLDSCGHGI